MWPGFDFGFIEFGVCSRLARENTFRSLGVVLFNDSPTSVKEVTSLYIFKKSLTFMLAIRFLLI